MEKKNICIKKEKAKERERERESLYFSLVFSKG